MIKFALEIFLNKISNFPQFCFIVGISNGYKIKYAWELRSLNRYVSVILNHDVLTMRVIINILKQTLICDFLLNSPKFRK